MGVVALEQNCGLVGTEDDISSAWISIDVDIAELGVHLGWSVAFSEVYFAALTSWRTLETSVCSWTAAEGTLSAS